MSTDLCTIVRVGDAVRFWTLATGLQPQYGTVYALHTTSEDIPYAEIIPNAEPERHRFLCYRAVWGFEPVQAHERRRLSSEGEVMSDKDITVKVHFIDGTIKIVPAKDIHWVGEEGARSGTALYEGREYPIYNRSDWPDPGLWVEQMTYEQWKQGQ